ncbi:lanthionine synthetase LanC family protein [Fodinicola feengrottensis]|uniref:lanthionine synthetase LanC family protein n=1 Tax=Fodinicola feengrottensis TaxID=435914 RepID=UPI0013D5862A|nr:lanthionine synthetase LanC family protein [Fodinicola feengrottensis]
MYGNDRDPAHLAVVRRCVRAVLAADPVGGDPDPLPPAAAVEPSVGSAHGLAGITEFLLCASPYDPAAAAAVDDFVELLVKRTESLLTRMGTRFTLPLSASWCQGLAGVGQTLLRAGEVLDNVDLTRLAYQTGAAVTDFLPHIIVPIQCCGLVGAGNFLMTSLALRDGNWAPAQATAAHILIRAAGPANHPVLTAKSVEDGSASLAFGVAGALGFFRRLSRHGGPFSLPLFS